MCSSLEAWGLPSVSRGCSPSFPWGPNSILTASFSRHSTLTLTLVHSQVPLWSHWVHLDSLVSTSSPQPDSPLPWTWQSRGWDQHGTSLEAIMLPTSVQCSNLGNKHIITCFSELLQDIPCNMNRIILSTWLMSNKCYYLSCSPNVNSPSDDKQK